MARPTAFHLDAGLELAAAGVPHADREAAGRPTPPRPSSSSRRSRRRVWSTPWATSSAATPPCVALRERLEAGELGEIYQVATRRQGPFPNRIADVGVVKDLATHDIDLTAWVIQSPYASVSAHTSHKSGREHEDLISITARMADGTVANHLVNWLSPLKERITVVTGERGAFVADTLHGDLTFHENGEIATEWDHGADVPRRDRGQQHPFRDRQAGAAAGPARELP